MMELIIIFPFLLSGTLVLGALISYKFYKIGYDKGAQDKIMFAEKRVAEYRAEQQWEYEDTFNPLTRYNKATHEIQKRYVVHSAEISGASPKLSEWRTITKNKKEAA